MMVRSLGLLFICALVIAQSLPVENARSIEKTRPIENIQLRGNRFRGLSYQEMTPEQRVMLDHTVNSARAVTNTTANGPFNVLLRSPVLGDLSQQLGNRIRFTSGLDGKLRELATLMAGRAWSSKYEWYAHARYAKEEGIAPEVIDAIARNVTPDFQFMDAEQAALWHVCDELLYTRQIRAPLFDQALKVLGERRLVSVISLASYYEYVSMLLNVDGYPLPPDAPASAQTAVELLPPDALYRQPAGTAARGFIELSVDAMNPEQKKIAPTSHGNYQSLLRNPELGQTIEALGSALNRDEVLAAEDRRSALDAVRWQWNRKGRLTSSAAGTFASELLAKREVSNVTFQKTRAALGEQGMVNLMMLMGYANITCAQATLSGNMCGF